MAEKTSFRKLLDEARKKIATGYLKDEDASICEIALLLGFAEQIQEASGQQTGVAVVDISICIHLEYSVDDTEYSRYKNDHDRTPPRA